MSATGAIGSTTPTRSALDEEGSGAPIVTAVPRL